MLILNLLLSLLASLALVSGKDEIHIHYVSPTPGSMMAIAYCTELWHPFRRPRKMDFLLVDEQGQDYGTVLVDTMVYSCLY